MRPKLAILAGAVLTTGALVLAAVAATRGQPPNARAVTAGADTAQVHLEISGMTCGSCATTARIALEQSAGVFAARVSYDAARATVDYDPALTSPDAIGKRLTERTGYRATVVPAMTR